MHSVVGWFAFAAWGDGRLLRSLSLSPDSGIIENGWRTAPPQNKKRSCARPSDD
ncbi:DUF6928 family protein [Streptomyces canus]|uniref:DUF6928 family protein n=1 Tax=Streptomyces canus TaxID=58343 RepID=UPI003F6BE934